MELPGALLRPRGETTPPCLSVLEWDALVASSGRRIELSMTGNHSHCPITPVPVSMLCPFAVSPPFCLDLHVEQERVER